MATRTLSSLLRRWITSIDRVILFSVLAIVAIGIWVSMSSTPAIAMKLSLSPFHFVIHHIIITPVACLLMVFISFLQARHVRKLAAIGYVVCLVVIACTLLIGSEIKGARRWVSILGFSIQPSEFMKPILVVMTAWFIAEQYRDRRFPGILMSIVSLAIVIPLILIQPDIGMIIVMVATWIAQIFVSGVSITMMATFISSVICALVGIYFTFPHCADRVNRFLMGDSSDADSYQIRKSLDAFRSGGFFGKGPGEGEIKTLVPDAHSDFVFSVIGEEFGFLLCFAIIVLFVTIFARSIIRVIHSSSMFSFSAVFGIVFQICIQAVINICTALDVIPTKGMTLPFISYGGSSLLASAIGIGIVLSLTKRNSLMHEIL
ncbi:MAG: putative lipid II flippase FtsW [Holosporales bacterium]|nr:putative lipid II flippase FtsW [Holosporales bacterium]